jgi:hypothetical protein
VSYLQCEPIVLIWHGVCFTPAEQNHRTKWGKAMQTLTAVGHKNNVAVSSLDLSLVITDRNVLGYLAQFQDEETQCEKALEALKVGVIAILSANPLLFLDSAYKIARALAVAAARKEDAGELDLQKIQDQLDALAAWSDRIADMATKARTIQSSGKLIEQCANDLKQDLDGRVAIVLKALQQAASA